MSCVNIVKIAWDYVSDPNCKNGDVVVMVQYGEAEIAKYVSPKPKGSPAEGGNFTFVMCDNENDLEEEIFSVILAQYPEVGDEIDNPLLFYCPDKFTKKAIWRQYTIQS